MTTGATKARPAAGRAPKPVRVQAHRRRTWPWVLALVLVLALVGGAYYLVRWTSVLGLQQVTVAGVTGELAEEVRAAVDVPAGTPLITVDTGTLSAEVAAEVPAVFGVSVVRDWPNGLLVTATARVPVAVTAANGTWWLLDKEGKPYRAVAEPPDGVLPVELATPGTDDPATLAAITVVQALPNDVKADVKTVVAPSPYKISLNLRDGRTVVWGDPSRTQEKVAVLGPLLEQPGKVYDVSDPTLATVTG